MSRDLSIEGLVNMAATSENNLSEINTRITGGDLTREHRSLTIDNLNYGSEIDSRHFQSDGIRASQIVNEVSTLKFFIFVEGDFPQNFLVLIVCIIIATCNTRGKPINVFFLS